MTKLDWLKAKRRSRSFGAQITAEKAAIEHDHYMRLKAARDARRPRSQLVNSDNRPTYRVRKHRREPADGVWIVIGADRSPTGERQVRQFPNLAAAHRGGFPWAI